MFGLPVVALILLALLIALVTSGPRLAATLLEPDVLWGLLALQAAILIWRLVAVGTSIWTPQLPGPRRRDALPIAAILLVGHRPAGLRRICHRGGPRIARRDLRRDDARCRSPTARRSPTRASSKRRRRAPRSARRHHRRRRSRGSTCCMVGVDAGVGRNTYLTDTMIVASLDPVTETVSMVSIPRDMVDVPLSGRAQVPRQDQLLVSYARHHPKQFPGSDGTGFDVLHGALGTLLEGRIPYYARSTSAASSSRSTRSAASTSTSPARSATPHYDEYGFRTASRSRAGKHHLNGQQALAYARVRKPAGESDFTRAARQQEVVSGIRDRIVQGRLHRRPDRAAQGDRQTVKTNVPRKILPDLADATSQIGRDRDVSRRSSAIRWSAAPTTAAARSRSPTSATSARWPGDLPADRHAARREVPGRRVRAARSPAAASAAAGPPRRPSPRRSRRRSQHPSRRPSPPRRRPTPTAEATPTPSRRPRPSGPMGGTHRARDVRVGRHRPPGAGTVADMPRPSGSRPRLRASLILVAARATGLAATVVPRHRPCRPAGSPTSLTAQRSLRRLGSHDPRYEVSAAERL